MSIGFDRIYYIYRQSDIMQKIYKKSSVLKNLWCKIMPAVMRAEYKTVTLGRLDMIHFLPRRPFESLSPNTDGKIKLRIIHELPYLWNSIEPIISAFQNDPQYDILILLSGSFRIQDKISQCDALHLPYAFIGEGEGYSSQEDAPDILILYSFSDDVDFGNIRANTKLIIAPSTQLVSYTPDRGKLLHFIFQKSFGKYQPDYILLDSLLYRFITQADSSEYDTSKIVELGNVKYDRIYNAIKNGIVIEKWKKLNGKKILLYCPDHGYTNFYPGEMNSFDLYGPDLFQWMYGHPDIGMIFRPHPMLEKEMRELGIWSEEDLAQLKQAIDRSPNIVWDDHKTYEAAYANCDALLVDIGCGITASALPIGKPIGALYRDEAVRSFHPELSSALYQIKSLEQLYAFLAMMQKGEDPMKEIREAAAKKFVMHFDGKNAQRIKDFIDEKWREYQENSSTV